MTRVRRVRKPMKAGADYNESFFFDDHYAMSVLYCQETQYSGRLAVPRIVGSDCPPMEEDNGEAHACWKLMLFSRTRCPGKLACADHMNFRSCVSPSEDPDNAEIAQAKRNTLKAVSKPLAQPSRTQRPSFLPIYSSVLCERYRHVRG